MTFRGLCGSLWDITIPKILVYTAVFGGYDRVLPPGWQDRQVEFRLITDDPNLSVPGWKTVVVDSSPNPSEANRYFKFLYEVGENNFDLIVYVDGNLAVLRRLDSVFGKILNSEYTVGLFRHRQRSNVADEISACFALEKISEKELANELKELESAHRDWQWLPVWDASCIIKNNTCEKLGPLMEKWLALYKVNSTRDQLWLGAAVDCTKANVLQLPHYSYAFPPTLVRHPHVHRLRNLGWLYLACARFLLLVKLRLDRWTFLSR